MKNLNLFLFIFLSIFLFIRCEDDDKDDPQPKPNIQEVIDDTLEDWYLWQDELKTVDINNYSNVNDYFEAKLADKDKWSFIANLDALIAYFENGKYEGYGFNLALDANNRPYVGFVYEQSDLAKAGITRGSRITAINGISVPENPAQSDIDRIESELQKAQSQITFITTGGETKEVSAAKKEMQENTVLKYKVVEHAGKKVAYLAFNSFLEKSKDELNLAFEHFIAEGADELVLDMRYNGGGVTNIANLLASQITGNKYEGKVFAKTIFNDKKAVNNVNEPFKKADSAKEFDRLFVITTDQTASSSELVINGLKPYMDVILIGSKTHGKPVGMNILGSEELNLAIAPISFSTYNSKGAGDFFDGLPVNHEIADDPTHDWGAVEETNFKAALNYIENNSFPAATSLKSVREPLSLRKRKGLNQLINAY
ncbi:MAG: S41 family peptidase [Carboxylicivirga sp.]|jgi:C-terminal processing protease CtpA/Prc|nr:S41 family peptidase [Carboxylicivirga sp.]